MNKKHVKFELLEAKDIFDVDQFRFIKINMYEAICASEDPVHIIGEKVSFYSEDLVTPVCVKNDELLKTTTDKQVEEIRDSMEVVEDIDSDYITVTTFSLPAAHSKEILRIISERKK